MLSEFWFRCIGEFLLSKSVSAKSRTSKRFGWTQGRTYIRGHKGLFHGTVRHTFEVKPKNKFPVIYSNYFDDDQSEVKMNSGDVLRILDVGDS